MAVCLAVGGKAQPPAPHLAPLGGTGQSGIDLDKAAPGVITVGRHPRRAFRDRPQVVVALHAGRPTGIEGIERTFQPEIRAPAVIVAGMGTLTHDMAVKQVPAAQGKDQAAALGVAVPGQVDGVAVSEKILITDAHGAAVLTAGALEGQSRLQGPDVSHHDQQVNPILADGGGQDHRVIEIPLPAQDAFAFLQPVIVQGFAGRQQQLPADRLGAGRGMKPVQAAVQGVVLTAVGRVEDRQGHHLDIADDPALPAREIDLAPGLHEIEKAGIPGVEPGFAGLRARPGQGGRGQGQEDAAQNGAEQAGFHVVGHPGEPASMLPAPA